MIYDLAAGREPARRRLTDSEVLLVARHGLLGMLVASALDDLPQQAHAAYARLLARQEVMEAFLFRLLEELTVNDIRATVLKGPAVARRMYREPRLRTFTDLDLLVPADQIDEALGIIGARPEVPSIPPKTPTADKRNVPVVDPSGMRFNLDVHWDLFSYTQLQQRAHGATDQAWQRADYIADHPLGPLWMLPTDTMIAFLCAHAVLDHRFRLILFRDLTEASRLSVDWGRVVDFSGRWGLRSTTYLGLLMASRVTEAHIPDAVLESLRPRSTALRVAEWLLPRTDLARFDGHRPHILNLAVVLLHDDVSRRVRLAAQAPFAFPGWLRRVEAAPPGHGFEREDSIRPDVLMIVSGTHRRGAEVFGDRLADGLRRRGRTVELVALGESGEDTAVAATPLTLARRPRGRLDLVVLRRLRAVLRRTRPAVIFANGGATLRYAVLARIGLRPRPRLVYASIGEPDYWMRSRLSRRGQVLLHRSVDLVVAVSRVTRGQLEKSLGLHPDRVVVAHTGVPEEFLRIEGEPKGAELRLLFLGSLSAEKQPDVAVDVLLSLARPARLRVVGSGPLESPLRSLVARGGLEDRIEIVGSAADVRPHLAWADVLLSTSRTEGFPGVVLEAAAAGVPAVAFDVGGVAETIVDGTTGWLVPSDDREKMVERLSALADDRPTIARAGRAARRRIEADFAMEQIVEEYHALLTEDFARAGGLKVAHLTTVDMSLRYLVFPQLKAVVAAGGEAVGISAPGPHVGRLTASGVRHVALRHSTRGMDPLADVRAMFELWRVLRRERPHILHTHNPKPGVYGRIVGRLAGVPIVVNTVHGLYATPEDRLAKRVLVYGLEAIASRLSDAELVQSNEDYRLMWRRRLAPRSRLRHLGNGVDLDRFRPATRAERRRVRYELGVGEDEILMGAVGRLVREKGYLELFEAAEQLGENFRLICIGPEDPDKKDALSPEVIDAARRAGVVFLGMRDDVASLYQAMDVFVLPSHREGYPRGAMEACASGVPVVAADIRGCREVVADGVNGVLVPPKDVAALTAALSKLGSDPDLRERMGSEARAVAEARFDEKRIVTEVMDTYRAVAKRKKIDLPGLTRTAH